MPSGRPSDRYRARPGKPERSGTKGFGFILPDGGGKDVFVHITAVQKAGMQGLKDNQKVAFEVAEERGKPTAINLKAL